MTIRLRTRNPTHNHPLPPPHYPDSAETQTLKVSKEAFTDPTDTGAEYRALYTL